MDTATAPPEAAGGGSQAGAAIFWAGALAGTLDISSAFVIGATRGASPVRVLQSVASGLLGREAYQGGWATAALGLCCHFLIAYGAATAYFMASRRLRPLIERAALWGVIYGVAVYLFMNLVVLPLSAASPRYTVSGVAIQVAVHMTCVGLPIALAVRRFSGYATPA
jgi:hypothetical protein